MDFIKQLIICTLLCLVQSLVLNQITLFSCATPLLYVYLPILFRRNQPRWASLLWCFALGLSIDTFANTPGMAAASLTLVGAVQPSFLNLFLSHESDDNFKPSVQSMGFGKFFFYSSTLTFIHCLAFFALEMFSPADILHALACVAGSTILTVMLVITLESVRRE